MEYSYRAILLKKYDIGETDRMYSMFTQEGGKIRAVARGVRKSEAKLASQLETLNFAHISVMRGRGRGVIVSAVAEQNFPRIRESERALHSALLAVSLIHTHVEEGECDRELFSLLLLFLQSLEIVSALTCADAEEKNRFEEKVQLLFHGFAWKFLERLGYGIEMRSCAVGHEAFRKGDHYFFRSDVGGVVCSEHADGSQCAIPFSENAVKSLRIFFSNSIVALPKLRLKKSVFRELDMALKNFLNWVR